MPRSLDDEASASRPRAASIPRTIRDPSSVRLGERACAALADPSSSQALRTRIHLNAKSYAPTHSPTDVVSAQCRASPVFLSTLTRPPSSPATRRSLGDPASNANAAYSFQAGTFGHMRRHQDATFTFRDAGPAMHRLVLSIAGTPGARWREAAAHTTDLATALGQAPVPQDLPSSVGTLAARLTP